MCLDVSQGRRKDGTRIQIWRCKSGHPNMQFLVSEDGKGQIRWADEPSMCLAVAGGRDAPATPIQLKKCMEKGHKDQEFLAAGDLP